MYGSDEPFGQRSTFAIYKMEINVSGQLRVFLFRGPGCRKTMLDCFSESADNESLLLRITKRGEYQARHGGAPVGCVYGPRLGDERPQNESRQVFFSR